MKSNSGILIQKYLQGNISPSEEAELMRWVNESAANKKEYDEIALIWELTGKVPKKEFDTGAELERLFTKLELPEENSFSPKAKSTGKSFIHIYYPWLGVAATVSILFIIYLFVFPFFFTSKEAIVFSTGENEVKEAKLPDGTIVWLNSQSKLIYPKVFESQARAVELQGEGFFDVAKDENWPFTIHAGSSITKVLGTSFNLKTYPERSVEIVVVSGRVSFFSEKEPEKQVQLTAGMKGIYKASADSIFATKNNNEYFRAWQNNRLVFNNATLEEVLKVLNSKFNVEIQVSEQAILSCRFTSTFDKASLQEILNVLAFSLDLKYTQEGKNYMLKGKGCD